MLAGAPAAYPAVRLPLTATFLRRARRSLSSMHSFAVVSAQFGIGARPTPANSMGNNLWGLLCCFSEVHSTRSPHMPPGARCCGCREGRERGCALKVIAIPGATCPFFVENTAPRAKHSLFCSSVYFEWIPAARWSGRGLGSVGRTQPGTKRPVEYQKGGT